MHKGKIKKLVRDRGFGFISDTDGREVFFHQTSLVETTFGALSEDQPVEFEVEKSDKGPRAINVHVVQYYTHYQMSKKIKPNRKRRICRFTGCRHILSIYNPEVYCHVHQQLAISRQVPLMSLVKH